MSGWKWGIARALSEANAVCRCWRGPRTGLRILMYHAVGSRVASDSYGFSVSRELFACQMRLLRERPDVDLVGLEEGVGSGDPSTWAPAPFDQLRVPRLVEGVPSAVEGLAEGPSLGMSPHRGLHRLRVVVTFDDGFKDTLTIAAPLMVPSCIPWTVFATPALLGSSADYLTRGELRQLASLPGVSIGSHGLTHVPLTTCSDAQLYQELRDSRRALEDLLGRAVTALAYPHGAVDQRVRQAAAVCGYRLGACSRSDINPADRDPLVLCRTEIVGGDSPRVFAQKLEGAWDWTRWRSPDAAMTKRLN